jgi:acyl-CoA reductase-like NAD-dependent aldehyde dehydrogenase
MWQNNTIHIGGADIPAEGNRTMEVVSPANLKSVGSVGSGSSGDIDRAVAAARSAFGRGQWRAMSGAARGALLSRLADLIERDAAELGEMDARSIGRPTMETQILDLPNAVATFRYYAGWADKLEGRVVPTAGYFGRKTHSFVTREPIGVIGMIVPWNTPLMILSWKLAPALATGCTCVIKPAEQAPFSALRLGQLALEAGIPAGVINVVPGLGQEAGAALAQHPGIDKISFTGSPETGGVIMRAASQNFTRVALELAVALWACSSTRARFAPPAPGSSFTAAWSGASPKPLPVQPRPSWLAIRRVRVSRWGLSRRADSSSGWTATSRRAWPMARG